ncbi:class I adenylate-forming enzyme family protein [Streptomyces sp. O3]
MSSTRAVLDEDIPFATSGHTGDPVRWWRSAEQLRTEAELVARTLPGPIEQVVCFAPPEHLYGRLFGVVLPELRSVPVQAAWHDPSAVPDWRQDLRTLFVCVPSSWLILRSLARRIAGLPGAVALHGTGPVTPAARGVVRELAGAPLRAVEIFGSTETGAVAVRDLAPEASAERPWRLLDDVDVSVGADGRLTVRGPRLARRDDAVRPPAEWVMDDLVRPTSAREFTLLGRASRLIKVNGVRCDLAQVEEAVDRAFPETDVVCVPGVDPVRGEHYDVFHTGGVAGPDARAVWDVLSRALPGCPLPRSVRRVARIPRSATGKPLAGPLRDRLTGHGGGAA